MALKVVISDILVLGDRGGGMGGEGGRGAMLRGSHFM